MHIMFMFMSRSLKTEALSMYSLRLSMYVMLMSRSLKKRNVKHIMFARSLKTEALSMYSLQLSMYIMLMSRF